MYTIYESPISWVYQNNGVTVYIENVASYNTPYGWKFNVDIAKEGQRTQKRIVTRCPLLWKIDGGNLEPLKIAAETLDEALAIARKINRNYNGGQVIR